MATTAPTTRPAVGRSIRANLLDRRAVRGRHPPRRGPRRRRRPARRPDRASTPAARRRTSSSSTSRSSRDKIWWGPVNRPISEAHYDRLRARLVDYAASKDLYSQDCFIGAAPAHRRSLRVYTETAWASIFARNLFRRPTRATSWPASPRTSRSSASRRSRPTRRPRAPGPGRPSSSTCGRMEIIIVGTEYAGEIKKSAFTVMNYLMPDEGVLPMHSAINVGQDGDAAVFFGLSGTGKTTLSADPRRSLIGDDEHGWGDGITLQLRGRLLRQDDPPLADVRAGHLPDDAPVRDGPRERRPRPADARARPRLRAVHREHPRRLSARVHRQRRRDRGRRLAPGGRLPDRRRVRGPAADLAADPRAGRLPLHQRLHRQAGRHGGRGQGAEGDLLGLLRGAVHAAPSGRVRGDAGRAPRARRRPGLAGQHRLDRRPVRRRRSG